MPVHVGMRPRVDVDPATDVSGLCGRRGAAAPAGLVGRDEDLRTLEAALSDAAAHGGGLVLRGDPGIGKTALLSAAIARGQELGRRVLVTTGVQAEAHLPFAGLHELIRPLLGSAGTLPPMQRRALLSAFGQADDPAPEPFLIGLAALGLLSAHAARRPIVLAADDLQWLDQATQDTLAFLARRLESDPVLIVGAVQSGHDAAFVGASSRQLVVRGLDDRASRELLERHGADLDLPARKSILRQAQGNPLALVELPAVWRSPALRPEFNSEVVPLSARLEQAFAARLDELPRVTRDALLVAALDKDGSLTEIVAATAILNAAAGASDALEPAVAVGLISVGAVRVRFRHPLVRSGVLQTESARRRQKAHAALAQIMTDEPSRRIWHRAQATIGHDDRVADELEQNHIASIGRGSVATAISALERSAQLTSDSSTRGRRLLLAAEHAFGLGRADTVHRLLEAAARNTLSELEVARMAWLSEIFNDGVPGDARRIRQLCEVAERSAAAGDTSLALNLLHGAAMRTWWARTTPEASAQVVRTLLAVESGSSDARFVAALAVADPIGSSAAVRAALDRVVLETVTDPDSLRLLGQAAHAIGAPVRAMDYLDRAECRLREQGRLGLLSHVFGMVLHDRLELGFWSHAEASMDEARRLSGETGQPIWDIGTRIAQGMSAGLRGDAATAHAAATEVELVASRRGLNELLACVQLARGYAYLAEYRFDEAYCALRRVFDPADPAFHQVERFRAVMYLAEAAAHCDRGTEAADVLDGLRGVAQRSASTTLRHQLAYADAVLADDRAAEERFHTALAGDLVRWPWHRARLELAYGTWLRRQRRVAESREPLRSALGVLTAIGAASWADQARGQLRAAGERTGDERLAPHELLSAQELLIAQLASEGLSNRQIGERLFLSPRTVGTHLYRIFPKLDVTSRAQLAARLNHR
jgi:DNA-binding CsgD family transcriptional regulator